MKVKPFLGAAVVAGSFLSPAWPAVADPITDGVNCDLAANQGACAAIVSFSVAGGANPYVYVNGSQGPFLDISDPSQINYNYTDPNVTATASGSLATGVLKATAGDTQVYGGFDQLKIAANDIFTLSGPLGVVDITVMFTVTGTAMLGAVGPYGSSLVSGGDASIALCGPGGGFACGGDQFSDTFYTGFGQPFLGFDGPITLTHSWTFSQQVGAPFNVFYGMDIEVYGGSMFDLTDPGTLTFELPPGYSVQSVSGYSSGLPSSSVPEPATLAVFGAGLAGVGIVRRRKQRSISESGYAIRSL